MERPVFAGFGFIVDSPDWLFAFRHGYNESGCRKVTLQATDFAMSPFVRIIRQAPGGSAWTLKVG